MQQSLNFLQILDGAVKRNNSLAKSNVRDRIGSRRSRFPYTKAVLFD